MKICSWSISYVNSLHITTNKFVCTIFIQACALNTHNLFPFDWQPLLIWLLVIVIWHTYFVPIKFFALVFHIPVVLCNEFVGIIIICRLVLRYFAVILIIYVVIRARRKNLILLMYTYKLLLAEVDREEWDGIKWYCLESA